MISTLTRRSATLVTGANGFIGSHLVRALVARGEEVIAFVRPGADLRALRGVSSPLLRVRVGNISDANGVFASLRGCHRLIHAASLVQTSERARSEMFEVARSGTAAVLDAARRAEIERVVVTSSLLVAQAHELPESIREDERLDLASVNGYARAKRAAHDLALEFAERTGLWVSLVQPSFVVGPFDWKPTGTGNILVNYLRTPPSFRIPTMPGGFNFVSIDAVVEGHLLALDRGRSGQSYILGGHNFEHRQFYRLLSDLSALALPGRELTRTQAHWYARGAELYGRLMGEGPLLTRRIVEDYFGRYLFTGSEKAVRELGYTVQSPEGALLSAMEWYASSGYVPARVRRRARFDLPRREFGVTAAQ